MSPRSVRTRFLLAGVLLVAVMAACGAWNFVTFTRLSAVIGETLRDNQDKIDLTAALASGLEREDEIGKRAWYISSKITYYILFFSQAINS